MNPMNPIGMDWFGALCNTTVEWLRCLRRCKPPPPPLPPPASSDYYVSVPMEPSWYGNQYDSPWYSENFSANVTNAAHRYTGHHCKGDVNSMWVPGFVHKRDLLLYLNDVDVPRNENGQILT